MDFWFLAFTKEFCSFRSRALVLLTPMLPRQLYDAVNSAKPVCKMFQSGNCKKGGDCKKRHASVQSLSYKLPHTSRHQDADGNTTIVLRPPLKDAFVAKFEAEGAIPTIGAGRRIPGSPYIVFELENMKDPNNEACSRALHAGKVWVVRKDGTQHHTSGTSKATYPEYIGHGTSIEESFQIQKTGGMFITDGICGDSVYGFNCKATKQNVDGTVRIGFYSVAF